MRWRLGSLFWERRSFMKKVRYLVGSVGAVPVLGMMMPPPAVAAVQVPKAGTKIVSLRHSAVSRNGGGQIAHPANSGCDGNTEVHLKAGSVSTKFWYKNAAHDSAACIGTVEGTWSSILQYTVILFRVRVYSGSGTHKRMAYSTVKGATLVNAHTLTAGDGVHDWFGYTRGLPVEVCTAWLSSLKGVEASPQCATVR
jgi:hypothetical protein